MVEGTRPVNVSAFAIHSQIHQARPDVVAAAHAHSMHGRAWAAVGRPLDPITLEACAFYEDHVFFDDTQVVITEADEGARIASTLGPHKAAILRNHGLLTVGGTVEAAVWWFISMERCCQAQFLVEFDWKTAAGRCRPSDGNQGRERHASRRLVQLPAPVGEDRQGTARSAELANDRKEASMPVSGSNPSAIALFDLIVSYRITAIIHTAAQLGIADALADGPRTPGELAVSTGAHAPSLQRLLRALVAIGICRQTGQGEFALTEIGAHLAEGASQSLKAYALFEGDTVFRSWEDLVASVRTGKTAATLAGFDNGFDQMGRDPEAVRIFNDAMVSLTGMVAPAVLAAYDFSDVGQSLRRGRRLRRTPWRDPSSLSFDARSRIRFASLLRRSRETIGEAGGRWPRHVHRRRFLRVGACRSRRNHHEERHS